MRRLYTLTEDQYRRIMEASQPVPYMVFGGMEPSSPQENANRAWQRVAFEHSVKYDTIAPARDDEKNFYAEPMEANA